VCLSEICTGSGDAITEDAWWGRRGDVINEYNWPEQPRPPEKDWNIWRRLLRVLVASETTRKLVVHLGPWDGKCLSWTWWVDPSEDRLYNHQGQRFFEYHRLPGQGGRRTRTSRGFQLANEVTSLPIGVQRSMVRRRFRTVYHSGWRRTTQFLV
jgi:hypothetical protein